MRVQKTQQVFDRADIGIIVTEVGVWGDFVVHLVLILLVRVLIQLKRNYLL